MIALCSAVFCHPTLAQISHVAQNQTTLSVTSVSPAKYSVSSLPTTTISATFSDAVSQASLANSTFIVFGSITGRHQGQIALDATGTTATFTPSAGFAHGENIQVILTQGITSSKSGPLTGGYSWGFATKTSYGSGRYGLAASPAISIGISSGIATGDFNKDGFADIAVMDSAHNSINVLLDNRHGGFFASKSYTVGTAPDAILAADVDGDGDLDLIVANWGSNDVSVLKNDGTGSFGSAASFGVGTNPSALAAADIDNDGDIDIVVTNFSSNSVTFLLNNGTGMFTVRQTITVGNGPSGIVFADFNGDGLTDAALTNMTSNSVTILSNVADSLAIDTTYVIPGGSAPNGLEAFDFDKDGTPDLAISFGGSRNISIMLNSHNGFPVGRFYTSFPLIDVGATPYGLYGNDFDADADIDLAVANSAGNVTVFLNNGIAAPTPFDIPAAKASRAVVGLDFSGLGVMDLVVCGADGKLRILRDSVKTGLSPSISASVASVNFGTTADSVSATIVFYSSVLATSIDSVYAEPPFFYSPLSLPRILNPYDSLTLTMVFKPKAGILYTASLKIFSNASVPSLTTIPLSGTGDPSLAVEKAYGTVPQSFVLEQNYPNPFNPMTAIRYQLPAVSAVSLKVYDLNGKELAVLAEGEKNPGVYTVHWDGSSFPSGMYLYRLRVGQSDGDITKSFEETKKLLLLK